MTDQNRTIIGSSVVPFRLVFLMWLFFTVDLSGFELNGYGLYPRTVMGLIGVFSAPLLHGSLVHLLSNTVPLLFLGSTLFYYYHRIATKVFFVCYVVTNLLVWVLARPSIHIGASGLVYAIAAFLIAYGLIRRDIKSLLISTVVLIFYGYIFYGVLPTNSNISWESHLFGAIVGVFMAYIMRKAYVF